MSFFVMVSKAEMEEKNMNSTALGAGAEKAQEIIFISEAHEKFYYEKLKEIRYQDVYHKALCYCLGISDDTRRNANRIYDFKTGCVKTECLHEGWQTSGSVKVVRMAFNLYCNGTPSVDDYKDAEEQLNECRQYTVEELFCCAYAPYFWQAIQIRYALMDFIFYSTRLTATTVKMLGDLIEIRSDFSIFTDQFSEIVHVCNNFNLMIDLLFK